jgi:hypothetical protein
MCLPRVIKSFQNYRGVATTFYPTLVDQLILPPRDIFFVITSVVIAIIIGCVPTNRIESSRVQSSPVRPTKTRQCLSLIYSGHRGSAYKPTESFEYSHKSCRVKSLNAACFIFVTQTPVIGRDWCYFEKEMDVEKLILLVKAENCTGDGHR